MPQDKTFFLEKYNPDRMWHHNNWLKIYRKRGLFNLVNNYTFGYKRIPMPNF